MPRVSRASAKIFFKRKTLLGPVDISVVLWYEVDIVEDDTGPVVILHGLHEADVEEHGPVEGVWAGLVEQVDAVVELLSPEHWVKVPEEDGELGEAVSEGDDQSHVVIRRTTCWSPFAS